MDSSQFCSGKDLGENCGCRRFTKKPSQDPNLPALCRDCHHPEGFHAMPASSIGGIFASYKDAAKIAGLKPSADSELKASQSAATQESNAGLKRKAGNEEHGEPNKKKKAKMKNAVASGSGQSEHEGQKVLMGRVIFMPQGLERLSHSRKHAAYIATAPADDVLANMEQWSLAVNGLRVPLSFQQGWDSNRLDTWFRSLFPEAYSYLDEHYPLKSGQLHWRILIKARNHLALSPVLLPDGMEVSRYLCATGKKAHERKIHIASTHEIPYRVYSRGWGQDADRSSSDVTDSGSDSDSTLSDASANSMAYRQKGKHRKTKTSKSTSWGISEKPEGIRHEVKKRFHSRQGAGKQKAETLKEFISVHSDGSESDSDCLPLTVMDGMGPPDPPALSLPLVPQAHPSLAVNVLPTSVTPQPSGSASGPSLTGTSAPVATAPPVSIASTIINTFRRRSAYSRESYMIFSDGLDAPGDDPWGDA